MTFQIGPLAVPGALPVLLLAAVVTAWLGRRWGGPAGGQVMAVVWQSLLVAVLTARLAFVWQFREAYAAAPLAVLDFRDGGWRAEAGFIGAWAWALMKATGSSSRPPVPKRALLGAMAAGSALWLAGTVALSALPGTGRALPDIELATTQGAPVNLASFKGAPTVVNLWATWCAPCVREMPMLAQAQIDHPAVHFVFVNQREPAARVNAWIAAQGLSLRHVLLDDTRKAAAAFGHSALPTTLFFNARGELVSTRVGELSPATLTQSLQAATR